MAQHDYAIANADGATVRSDMNDLFTAIATKNSGTTTPSTTFAFQWWFDTTTSLLKVRNSGNSAWITVASFSGSTWIAYSNGTQIPAVGTAVGELFALVGVGSPAVAGLPAVDGSQLLNVGSGKLLQRVGTSDATYQGITAVITNDDSIPQNTEGTEIITQAITPIASDSVLRISAYVAGAGSAVLDMTAAIFVDSTANALAAQSVTPASLYFTPQTLIHELSAADTSARTYKLRVGVGSGTWYMNGNNGARRLGGVQRSWLIVEELGA